ncbi:arsenate reductase (glutaredoxin) [Aliagarivorans taiwanensis]|uniref:arsenate reductase (glutaredoxin) n=1 Tax=Aliagarivorans taiwanensis TaxID=561966 RepID=UPI00041CED45|nr:arsenate reductase (glutaredoxin) [Aliagarivorans taiwanensis]
MSGVKIYHNPRCSKSRETLKLLQDKGIEPEIVLYLETPPSVTELSGLLKQLALSPRELMRTKEAEYKELDLSDNELSDDQLLVAMHNHPKLIERPIVVANGQARIGRPPQQVMDIL